MKKPDDVETQAKIDAPEASAPAADKPTQAEVDAIVRKRVYTSMAIGLAPVPLLDLAGLSVVQLELVRALAKRYGVPFKADLAKGLVASFAGSVIPVAVGPIAASLLKMIPIIGTTTGAVSMSLVGGAATYAIGCIFAMHFESGGTLLDLNVVKFRTLFRSKFDEGKNVVAEMRQEAQPKSA